MWINFGIMYKALPTSLDQVGRANADTMISEKSNIWCQKRELTNNVDNKPQGREVSILEFKSNVRNESCCFCLGPTSKKRCPASELSRWWCLGAYTYRTCVCTRSILPGSTWSVLFLGTCHETYFVRKGDRMIPAQNRETCDSHKLEVQC